MRQQTHNRNSLHIYRTVQEDNLIIKCMLHVYFKLISAQIFNPLNPMDTQAILRYLNQEIINSSTQFIFLFYITLDSYLVASIKFLFFEKSI